MGVYSRGEGRYEKVLIEAYPGGRLNICAVDTTGFGHGYRMCGAQFNDDAHDLHPTITHELNTRDTAEIRAHLRHADHIHDPGWAPAVHDLTAALDSWKAHSQDVINFYRSGEPEARTALLAAARALTAALDPDNTGGQ